jgi:hypothetical protein
VGGRQFLESEGQSDFGNRTVWRRIEEELGRDLHRMFLIERPVVAFSMERHGARGAAAVSGAVPQLRAAHLRRLDHGAGALPSAAGTEGKAGSELDDLSFSRRFQRLLRVQLSSSRWIVRTTSNVPSTCLDFQH